MEEVVLCGASAYNKKFYLNEDFKGLPEQIKNELKIMCVLFTEDVGGIFQLVFSETGELEFRTSCDENDLLYDEIGCGLKIRQLQQTKQELLEALDRQALSPEARALTAEAARQIQLIQQEEEDAHGL